MSSIAKVQPLNFDKFTFRCSSLGKIMGEATIISSKIELDKKQEEIDEHKAKMFEVPEDKQKNKAYLNMVTKLEKLNNEFIEIKNNQKPDIIKLPDTCTTYLLEVYVSQKYGIKKDIYSKYFEKGIAVESEAIEFLSEVHDRFYEKWDGGRIKNEFIEGEIDIQYITEEMRKLIIDMKNAWDLFTFYSKVNKEMIKMYKWQGVGYLELWDADEFIIAYALMNMPQNLIDDELKRMLYKFGSNMEYSTEYQNAVSEYVKTTTFDHLTPKERIFDDLRFTRNKDEYNQVVDRVKLCRNWLNEYAIKDFIRVYGEDAYKTYCEENHIVSDEAAEVVEETRMIELREEPSNIGTFLATKEDAEIIINGIKPTIQELPQHTEIIDIMDSEIVEETMEEEVVEEVEEKDFAEGGDLVDEEPNCTLRKIQECKDEQDCIDLWRESTKLFAEHPIIKEKLLEKRASLKPKVEEEPAKEVKKEEIKAKVEKPKVVEAPKESTQLAQPQTVQSDRAILLMEQINTCKTHTQVKAIYTSAENKPFVNLPENRQLKKDIEKVYIELEANPKV